MFIIEHRRQADGIACDAILVAVGRVPNLEGLGLDAAAVRYGMRGVDVDARMRTSNPRVYAAGDVCSRYQFTHAADAMARIVIANALFLARRKATDLVMPWCTYTDPEIAHVGYYEKAAQAAGYDVATLTQPLSEVDRAILDGEANGFARVHYDKKSGRDSWRHHRRAPRRRDVGRVDAGDHGEADDGSVVVDDSFLPDPGRSAAQDRRCLHAHQADADG